MDLLLLLLKYLKPYLHSKYDDSAKANPAVQTVHVCYWFLCKIVWIEDRLQSNCREDESKHMQDRMQRLDVNLLVISEHSIHKNCWK